MFFFSMIREYMSSFLWKLNFQSRSDAKNRGIDEKEKGESFLESSTIAKGTAGQKKKKKQPQVSQN